MYTCWEIVHPSVFAQELNRIMGWWQLRRSLLSFFPVNPGKKLRGFPGCRQAMILFRRRGGMGVMYAFCSLCEIVRKCQCVGCGLSCIPENTSRAAPWSPDCNSLATIGESKGAGRCFP